MHGQLPTNNDETCSKLARIPGGTTDSGATAKFSHRGQNFVFLQGKKCSLTTPHLWKGSKRAPQTHPSSRNPHGEGETSSREANPPAPPCLPIPQGGKIAAGTLPGPPPPGSGSQRPGGARSRPGPAAGRWPAERRRARRRPRSTSRRRTGLLPGPTVHGGGGGDTLAPPRLSPHGCPPLPKLLTSGGARIQRHGTSRRAVKTSPRQPPPPPTEPAVYPRRRRRRRREVTRGDAHAR